MPPHTSVLSSSVCLSIVLILLLPSTFGLAQQNSVSAPAYSTSDWLNWARTAWQYYQPDVGVNAQTGLHKATLSWHCLTDWDVGSYIFAAIFARRLDLISDGTGSGDWQFEDRINKILTFLQNRPLSQSRPYMAYDWSSATACSDTGSALSDSADQGRLLSALHALRVFRPNYASQVGSIFARTQPAYSTLSKLAPGYYGYLFAEGYAAFGYDESGVFDAVDSYNGPFTTVYGQELPLLKTTAEPLNHLILEDEYQVHSASPALLDFARRVNLAQSGRFSSTNLLTAWSEGSYHNPDYLYEWILANTGSWRTWILGDATPSKVYNVQPVAYTKVAFSYLAIYGENSYTLKLVDEAKQLATSQGFGEGTLENGGSAIGIWPSDTGGFYSDKTNYFILAAAAYAISHSTSSTTTSTMNPSSSTTLTTTTAQLSTTSTKVTTGDVLEISSAVGVGIIIAVAVYLMSRRRRRT